MNKIFDYSKLTFNELIEKISIARFFHLPKMVAEAFRKIPAGGSEPKYKVYTALLSQSGTDAPVATVLENTLGGEIVWSREGFGFYKGTLIGGYFAENNIFFSVITNTTGANSDDSLTIYVYSPEEIGINTALNQEFTDGRMYFSPIEIRVYS